MRRVAGPEAAERFAEDPDSVCWSIYEFKERLRLTDGEVLGELRSGRLVAHFAQGKPVILGSSMAAWLSNSAVDERLRTRWSLWDANAGRKGLKAAP